MVTVKPHEVSATSLNLDRVAGYIDLGDFYLIDS